MTETRADGTRRDFLKGASCGILGGLAAWSLPARILGEDPPASGEENRGPDANRNGRSRASLVHGSSRAENVYRALKLIEADVKAGLATKKKVVIKPNMVSVSRQLSASHADCLEAMLEFFAGLVKDEVIIAESPAGGSAAEGFDNYGYMRLEKKYKVRFVDLDLEPSTTRHVIDDRFYPRPVRFSRLLLNPDVYVVSSAVLKTHDRVMVTLGLKNVAVGAILKDKDFRWGQGKRRKNDKPLVHGGRNNAGIHFNLFQLAQQVPPDLALLDGFQGMEQNGPVGGKPVDHGVAVASTDWLAADRVGVELMGFDFRKIGYLWFSSQAGLGEGDLKRIDILGERVEDHKRTYRPHDSIERQYGWMRA